MDLDDEELKATRKLHNNMYKNVKFKQLDEKDELINLMAHDLLYLESRPYFYNVFNEEQVINCYKKKIKGDSEWYINI